MWGDHQIRVGVGMAGRDMFEKGALDVTHSSPGESLRQRTLRRGHARSIGTLREGRVAAW